MIAIDVVGETVVLVGATVVVVVVVVEVVDVAATAGAKPNDRIGLVKYLMLASMVT